MGIIEDLKKQAQQNKKQHGSDSDDLLKFNQASLVTQLQKIHQFLRELVEQLHAAEPDIRVDLPVMKIGTCTGLKQEHFRLLAESNINAEVLSLTCNLVNEQPCQLPIKDFEKINNLPEQLYAMDVRSEIITTPDKDPCLEITGGIPARFIFEVDPHAGLIRVKIRNYTELGHKHFHLKPEQIDDDFLETLGEFILRKNTNLLSILQESTSGILQTPIPEAGPQTEQMDTSRLKSIFNQDVKIYLTYHNNIKELNSKSNEFILGRSTNCDLLIDSDLASRQHAKILFRKGKFVLIDTSTNGTFVKTQGGKEIYVQREEFPLSGSGFISLGKAVSVDNEHMVYFSCQ